MEVVSIEMLSFTLETQEEKKVVVKEAEPTGWPRRQNPVLSLTGRDGADLSVGCDRVENSAIVVVIDVVRVGLIMLRRGSVDDPLQEVSIRMKEPTFKHLQILRPLLANLHTRQDSTT